MSVVLDASALLAWLHGEPGSGAVGNCLEGASISAVNWSEVLQKSRQKGVNVEGMGDDLGQLGLTIEPFTPAQAEMAAELWLKTRQRGLSLGDRACLALAQGRSAEVLTADQAWGQLELPVQIRVIR